MAGPPAGLLMVTILSAAARIDNVVGSDAPSSA
ncbi:hypothetical protein MELE44368_15590 [Mycolicibacterium elephantis DSM 44368]|uniref:Uncharacterized protein n=1 Tax=Mycolicibacterium elephantis DSM 44368 TaxID=1335622 RepID=A0A439DW97_9MYCO|nr:hypothetical protein MELE44368_15590 [Mycolicibacterium elephantis DSM 44368]